MPITLASPTLTIARFTWLEATRNRLLGVLICTGLAGLLFAEFIGELTIAESAAIQVTLLASILRIIAVFSTCLFIITTVLREQQDKSQQLLMALPIKRSAYYWGKFLGFSWLSCITSVLFALPLLAYSSPHAVALWGFSLYCELAIISALSLLVLFTLNQIISSMMAVISFYVLARSINAFQLMAENPVGQLGRGEDSLMVNVISAINQCLPSLDLYTRSEWLLYAPPNLSDIAYLIGQSTLYVLLLSMAALFDFYRKCL